MSVTDDVDSTSIEMIQGAIQHFPNNPLYLERLAEKYFLTMNSDDAMATYKVLRAKYPHYDTKRIERRVSDYYLYNRKFHLASEIFWKGIRTIIGY